jgi:hypothetical protein
MKILSIEVQTDVGRRVIQLGVPLDVDPNGDMPIQFRSLTEVLWGLLRDGAVEIPVPQKAEA